MGVYKALLESVKDSLDIFKAKLKDGTTAYIVVKETKTINKNDKQGSNGVRLKFYDGKTYIGVLCISGIDTDIPFLYDFEIKESLRSRGYGGSILDYCIKKYKLNDLAVDTNNKRALKLYERHGFKKRFVYKDNGNNLIYMQIHKRGYENR